MNRSVVLLLGAVIVLGAVAYVATQDDTEPALKALSIAGFATAEQLAAERNRGMLDPREEIPSPVDEIIIVRADWTLHLKRSGVGKESTWSLEKPDRAPATRFQANKMVNLFKTATRSVYSTSVSEGELGLYDLEPARRIQVTLKAAGAVWRGADLVIGKVEKSETETADESARSDTWVQHAGDTRYVYRVAGKDLRSAFEVAVTELRDKAVFVIKPEDVVSLEVTSPEGQKIALAGTTTVPPSSGDANAPKPQGKTLWTLTEPTGFEADDTVSTLVRSFANVRTREFVQEKDAPKDALTGKTWKLVGTTADSRTVELTLAADEGDQVFARASGVAELLKIDNYTAKNLRKGLADVRHRGVMKLRPEAIEGVAFAPEGEKVFGVKKVETAWRYAKGKGRADVESLVKGLTTIKASRFARPGELEAARAAVASPDFVATLTTSSGSLDLRVGPKMDGEATKGQRWAVTRLGKEDSDPFLLQDHMAKRFRKTRAEIAYKKLFDGKVDAIETITVQVPEQTPVKLSRPSAGAPLALEQVPEGKKVKEALVKAIGSALASARAKVIHPKKKAKDVGLGLDTNLRVTFTAATGTQSLEVSEQKDGNDPYALVTGGPLDGRIITIAAFQTAKLRKTLDDLTE